MSVEVVETHWSPKCTFRPAGITRVKGICTSGEAAVQKGRRKRLMKIPNITLLFQCKTSINFLFQLPIGVNRTIMHALAVPEIVTAGHVVGRA
jgi:hypothetical protein